MLYPYLLPLVSLATQISLAKTVTYNWDVTWTTANPDGQFERKVIGINGEWPIPVVEVDKGDRVIINMYNGLENQNTSIHFHGLFQNGTAHMDGPVQVSQCAVGPGQRMTYDFKVDQPGTYWYHSHNRGQYPDGLRGPWIVHDKDDPHKDLYDKEIVLTLSDWYHRQMPELIGEFLSYTNPTGAEPVPQAALMNDSQDITLDVEPGKTYLVRIVNMAAFAAQYLWFEDHVMRVVEVDGVYTDPLEANMLYLTAAQRVSVLLTMKNDTSRNYAFVGSMDEDLFDQVPDGLNANVTGWLMYNNDAPRPSPALIDEFAPLDDFLLIPADHEKLLPGPDYTISLDVTMDNLDDGANYAFFNGITYVHPKVPTLYTVLSTGDLAANPVLYGVNTLPYVLSHMSVIEIVVNNNDPGKHPFHLHGHNFQVVHRSEDDAGNYNPGTAAAPPESPMRRDVVLAPPNGNVVIRFRADNPGIWLFHCHLEWHLVSGLVATMIEAPLQLQKNLTIPDDHWAACKHLGILTEGNAAGNTDDLLDLTGANVSPPPLPTGFTITGTVALILSTVTAILGMTVIVVYGLAEPVGSVQGK